MDTQTFLIFTEKSNLWTDTGVDQNFQRDLGTIGPHEFQGKSIWTTWCLFRETRYGPMAAKGVRSFPEIGIGPWMALPSLYPNSTCLMYGIGPGPSQEQSRTPGIAGHALRAGFPT